MMRLKRGCPKADADVATDQSYHNGDHENETDHDEHAAGEQRESNLATCGASQSELVGCQAESPSRKVNHAYRDHCPDKRQHVGDRRHMNDSVELHVPGDTIQTLGSVGRAGRAGLIPP